jgi:hypothetical protein
MEQITPSWEVWYFCEISQHANFHGEAVSPHPTPKPEYHPVSAVLGFLLSISAAISPTRNLMTRNTAVTRDTHYVEQQQQQQQ